MLLINAVNAEGRPVELYAKDGKIAAVGQGLAALAGEDETVLYPNCIRTIFHFTFKKRAEVLQI